MNTTCPDCGIYIYKPFLQRERNGFDLCYKCGIKEREKLKLKDRKNIDNNNGKKIK